jgi:predicted nucleic acid-binding Zn ribbon protein
MISMSTFHLKGSGWYTTDYAGKSQATSTTKSEEPSKSEKVEKVEKKSEGGSAD